MLVKYLILSSFVTAFFFAVPNSFAQTTSAIGFDATVSPTFIEIGATPGETVNKSVRLRNNTNSTVTLTAEVKIMGGDEQGELTIREDKAEYLEWMKITDAQVELRPKEWVTVPFSIEIPESAAYGYYWALSFTSDNEANQITGTTLNASIVVPVLLAVVKSGAKTEGKLLDFKASSGYYEYTPVTFTSTFENTGNVHVRPQGNIFIKDFLGREVAILNVNEAQGNVLPGIKRSFESTWNDGFITYEPKMADGEVVMDDSGKPQREMKIHFQKILDLRIGKYTATALILVSGQDRDYTYEKSITFFVFPWKVVLVLIVIIVFVGVGLFTTFRSVFRRIGKIFKK